MDAVIITGASGEPALSIARRLCALGIRVYALAGNVPETGLSADEFVPVSCDMTSPNSVIAAVEKILEKDPHISGLVLAGQYLSEECFEAVSPEEIQLAFNAQTVSPLCAARLVLPSVIAARGHVVIVSPGTETTSAHALNATTDGALQAFAAALFTELRDTGVKTCHILLQNNAGAPDPAARFTTSPQSRIHADIVADAVETVFKLRENNALTQMILRPQATRETPHIPVSAEPKIRSLQIVQLPPAKNFPPEEEPIPTPAYRRPDYAPAKAEQTSNEQENEDGFAEDYIDPELRYLVKNSPPKQDRPRQPGKNIVPSQHSDENSKHREGRNRRRKRNRRNRDGAMRISPPQFDTPPQQHSNPADTRDSSEEAPLSTADFSKSVPKEKTPQQENISDPEKLHTEKTHLSTNTNATAENRRDVPETDTPMPQEAIQTAKQKAECREKKERQAKTPRKPRTENKLRLPRKRKSLAETEPPPPATEK